jgi:allantoate deiminase
MHAVGLDAARIRDAARDDIDAWIELHVEQGPILETEQLPVGIVWSITGIRLYVVEVVGRSDHAGARPMDTRLDPVAGAAEMISGVIGIAEELARPAVTTVGRLHVQPNLAFAVPASVVFTVDTRHPDAERIREQHARQEDLMRSVADRRGLQIGWNVPLDLPPCVCDQGVISGLKDAAHGQGVPFLTMHSGAAHDTQNMAAVAKVGMVFVRSKGGRSHTPEELTTTEDAVAGMRVLAAALHALAYGDAGGK